MKTITKQVETLYKYDNKFYRMSPKNRLEVNDVFIDGRDYSFKLVESNHDVWDMSYVAPELYCILEEVTVQN